MSEIYFAAGCFWGVEAYFKKLKGVNQTTVGYAQGTIENPSYEQVCSGRYGFSEACQIIYDETVISLEKLIEHFFRIINPTRLNAQGNDIGIQYRTGIYYSTNDQEDVLPIIKSAFALQQTHYTKPIVVEYEPLRNYYLAESFHQDYLDAHPNGYCHVNFAVIKPEELKGEYKEKE